MSASVRTFPEISWHLEETDCRSDMESPAADALLDAAHAGSTAGDDRVYTDTTACVDAGTSATGAGPGYTDHTMGEQTETNDGCTLGHVPSRWRSTWQTPNVW